MAEYTSKFIVTCRRCDSTNVRITSYITPDCDDPFFSIECNDCLEIYEEQFGE